MDMPPEIRPVRPVHSLAVNSFASTQIGDGDPSDCCITVQTSATLGESMNCQFLIDLAVRTVGFADNP